MKDSFLIKTVEHAYWQRRKIRSYIHMHFLSKEPFASDLMTDAGYCLDRNEHNCFRIEEKAYSPEFLPCNEKLL